MAKNKNKPPKGIKKNTKKTTTEPTTTEAEYPALSPRDRRTVQSTGEAVTRAHEAMQSGDAEAMRKVYPALVQATKDIGRFRLLARRLMGSR